MKKWIRIMLAALAAASPAFAESAPKSGTYIPSGDPDKGRATFIRLNCIACHTVKGDADLKAPWSAHKGPALRDPSRVLTPGDILDSILLPSHRIADSEQAQGQASPMGSYFPHAMTGEELLDIAAYLRSQG